MAKFTTFRIPLKGAQQGTQHFEFKLDDKFFSDMESLDIMGGAVTVTLKVRRSNEANYLSFHCEGEIKIPCDRCLEPMTETVNTDYDLAVKFGDEYNDETDGVLIVPNSDNDLNVASIIYDTVALTIPIHHVHADGECNEETWEALKAHTAHNIDDDDAEYGSYADDDSDQQADAALSDGINEANIDPRWAELLKLKDNKLKNK